MVKIFRLIYPAPVEYHLGSKECFTYFYRVAKLIGWIRPREGTRRYLYQLWFCFILTFSNIYIPIGMALSLAKNFATLNLDSLLSVIEVTVNTVGSASKCFLFLFNLSRLNRFECVLDLMDNRLIRADDRRRIHQAIADTNYIFLAYAILFGVYAKFVFIMGLMNGQPPWMLYNPLFDWQNGLIYLLLHSVLEHFLFLLLIAAALLVDTYPLIFFQILRAHIDVLRNHIQTLCTDPLKLEADNYEELVDCILHHKLILKCCEIQRPLISGVIFIHFLLVGIVLGVSIINILYSTNVAHLIQTFLFLIALLFESFPCCYLSDMLAEEIRELSNIMAQMNWINAERKFKSTLIIFMLNVQKPIAFKAGGIFPISIDSNIKVAKFAFSVMTIMQQMNLDDRSN